jgi:hypothetical protein
MLHSGNNRWYILASLLVLGFFIVGSARPALAQTDRGVITGTVTDKLGASVPAVQVIGIQETTGMQFQAVSNNLGAYSLLNLPVGRYDLSFRKDGFKDLVQPGIILEAQHTIRMDAKLEVGSVTETVTVTSASPVLELQSEVGTNMTAQAMTDLPLTANGGRDMTAFAFAVTPNVSGSEWASNIGNSQSFTKSVLIDGTSSDSGIVGHVQESEPSMDAIQESQVDSTGLRAEDGRSGGGAFLYEMKSGTNAFHGSSYGFLANEALDANTWDNNWYRSQCASNDTSCKNEYKRARNRYDDYGFSAGGPVWRQWLGLKKMYVFGAYEKYDQEDYRESANQATVPSAKMLTGDFSELLAYAASAQGSTVCPKSPCPIMNGSVPYTDWAGNTIYYGSIYAPSWATYPGNIITDSISARAKSLISLYQKHYQPSQAGVTLNYPALMNAYPSDHHTQLSFKYDWELRPNDKVAVSYIYTLRPRVAASGLWQSGTKDGGPLTDSSTQTVISNAFRGNETHVFNTNLVNTIAYTFNDIQNKWNPTSTSAGPSTLDLQSYDPLKGLPVIGLNGAPDGVSEAWLGSNAGNGGYVAYNAILSDTLSWSKGRHIIKAGFEYRALGFNDDTKAGGLTYNFSNESFAPTNTSIQSYVGSALANMMLGYAQSATSAVAFYQQSRRKETSFFVQDDIRVNSRLTVNADLRWELTGPLHVLGGKWSNYDINAANPLFNNIPGAYAWLAHSGDSFETRADWHQFGPKVGGSYQITGKLVARASAGINFVPIGWNQYDATPYGSAQGYTAINQVAQVWPNTPAFQWDTSAYPGVYTAPAGKVNTMAMQKVGGPTYVDPHTRQLGFTENWFAGLQYELPGSAKIEVSYMGNDGRNLHAGQLNPKNFPQWSTYQPLLASGHAEDTVSDAVSAAAVGVPYPYPGFSGEAFMALNPFPQVWANTWSGVRFTDSPLGHTTYNAVTVEGTKQRGSFSIDLSYNWSRSTGNTGSALAENWSTNWTNNFPYQNPYNYKREANWPSTYDQVKGYVIYSLPFGAGRRFLSNSRMTNYFVGGWQAGATVWYGNGTLFGAVGASYWYPGWSTPYTNVAPGASFKNTFKRWNPGLNTSAESLYFNPANFSNPTWGQLGNSPTIFKNWRGWSVPTENASLLKKTHFGADKRYVFTIRAEFFNLFNRHYWDAPSTNYWDQNTFGHVLGVYGNRVGQVGARFEW